MLASGSVAFQRPREKMSLTYKGHKRGKKKLECICKMCLFEICVRFAVLILSKEKKGACIDGDMYLINIAEHLLCAKGYARC